MALVLHVDGDRWRAHLRGTVERQPGLVPVIKGNGYGLGLHRLARRAQWLGVDTVAVGTHHELPELHQRFDGDLLVLSPWRPFQPTPEELEIDPARVVHTVGRLQDLEALDEQGRTAGRPVRVVLERLTSMLRHGLPAVDVRDALRVVGDGRGVRLEGVALHLPLPVTRPTLLTKPSHVPEVERILSDPQLADLARFGERATQVWVSHLTESELEILALKFPGARFRPRVGTGLWLGDRGALRVTGTVLDAHPVERGDTYGYRGRSAPRRGTLLVVSGGTSHGIGLEAPTGEATLKARAASIARGGLDAAGFVRSPYSVGGKQRLFAEPPHMQVSMLFIPHGAPVPVVGQELDVRVRYTATAFDRVEIS
ncbi:Alanine racemase, N-terminal domain [Nocardioides scoriae]|uniref:Alanine racemase, N-terminal domain n=1 Tax=Nocardioides scoriae TaxID=642780 RepID=A0A1H1VVW2_9ACTN|nr:alanine racemase [Nocardioides scoriae]SDS88386.1 Alanine racemase, N-terminal domain [Nocardioides scoriae]